ncbi:Heat shock protein sti1-like, partial [Durusdinium trenchii]
MVTEILRAIQEEVITRFPDRFQNHHGKPATVYMTTSTEAWNEALDMANSTFQATRYKQFVLPVSDPLFKKAWELTQWNHMERVQIAWQPITWRFPTHVPHTHRAAAMRYTDGTMEVIEEDLGKLRHPRARFTKPVQLAIFMFGQNNAEAEVTPSASKRPRSDPSLGTQDPQQFQPQELHPSQSQEDDPLRLVRKDADEITFPPELKLTAEIKLAVKRMHKNLGLPDQTAVRDVKGTNYLVLGIIDEVTHLHVGTLLANRTPEEASNRPRRFIPLDAMDEAEVYVDYIPAEAHNKIGLVERHNATYRSLMERIVDAQGVTGYDQMDIVTAMASHAKNSCTWSTGRPPYVAAFGRIARQGLELLSDPHGLITGQTRSQAQQFADTIRAEAQQQLAAMSIDSTLRRALLRNTTPGPSDIPEIGSTVAYWR